MGSDVNIEKLQTGIPGFDIISFGGLPKGRTTLVTGTAGSAKTVFASQFLAEGIRQCGEPGVMVTFEESPNDIRSNMRSLGWDIEQWEAEGKFAFVDASPDPVQDPMLVGAYDMGALMARLEHAISRVKARRVSLDSLGAIFTQFADSGVVRSELYRISHALKRLGVTAVLTAERNDEYGEISRYGVEEFVADNVIILRHILEDERRRRTMEILKFRGTNHQKGEFPFTIVPDEGIVGIPLSGIELTQESTSVRIHSGNESLDKMCGGGYFRDSIILVSGATGTGKTLMVTEFMAGGCNHDEKCLLFAFEESREQLFRNAVGWGIDFPAMEAAGKLKVICEYPELTNLEDRLVRMRDEIDRYKPDRIAVDSLSALERVSSVKSFREFVIGLTSLIKRDQIAGLFTATTSTLLGGTSTTESHISTITDSIILLRYVEIHGEMRRGVTVLKMRGSMHDKQIREFRIDGEGMHIGRAFRSVAGILSGNPQHFRADEIERMEDLFDTDDPTDQ